jgi:branched-chain amino acid transport system substrate-binding protein
VSRRSAGALLALLFLAGCSAVPPQPATAAIAIGVDVPETGPQGADGIAVVDAVNQVLNDEFGGKIEGIPVSVRPMDDSVNGRRDPAQGERNLEGMVANPALMGVIGPLNSDLAGTEIPVAGNAHLVMISPSASNQCLTKALPECVTSPRDLRQGAVNGFFRVVPTDDLEPAALVDFATRMLHASRVAVASDGQSYGRSVRAGLETALKVAGLSVVATRDFDPNSQSAVDSFLSDAKAGGADAVFFEGRGDGGACKVHARMVADLGASVSLLGGSGLQGATCLKDAGPGGAPFYSIEAGTGSVSQQAKIAARVLLLALKGAVKAAGGNLPTRDDVRLAVSQSTAPRFDPAGDTRDRVFTILRAQAAPAGWAPESQVSL